MIGLGVCVASPLVVVPDRAGAQCVGNMVAELAGLDAVARDVESATFAKDAAAKDAAKDAGKDAGKDDAPPTRWAKFQKALRDDGSFSKSLASAGPSMPCLLERKDQYRNAAEAVLKPQMTDKAKEDALSEAQVREALRAGAAAALATRYAPTDRLGAFFGFGAAVIQHEDDTPVYKVVSRRGAGDDTATHQYIVQESGSRALPVATTGLTIRFRDRAPSTKCGPETRKVRSWLAACGFWVADRAWPTTVFGAVQFGGGEGPVSGTTLGVGWRLVADVNLLAGYGITRLPTLRPDIEKSFRNEKSGVLLLPAGENEESIKGTQSQQAFTITLGIPLALRNALGGK